MACTPDSRFHPLQRQLQPWQLPGYQARHSACSAGGRRTVLGTCCDLGSMRRVDVATVKSGRSEHRAGGCCGWSGKLSYSLRSSSCNQAECVLVNVMTAVVVGIARSPSYWETGSARSGEIAYTQTRNHEPETNSWAKLKITKRGWRTSTRSQFSQWREFEVLQNGF